MSDILTLDIIGNIKKYIHSYLCGGCGIRIAWALRTQDVFLLCENCKSRLENERS